MKAPRLVGYRFRLRSLWFVGLCAGAATLGTEWPQYRGAAHDGISPDRIKQQWAIEAPTEIWRVPCTKGFSSFSISGGRAFTQISRDNGSGPEELCVAYDANSGAEWWASSIGPAVYDSGPGSPDDGPRSTPSVQQGRVFVLSSYLVLHSLDAANGSPIWSKDLRTQYGGAGIGWQNSASPLVKDDLVFVNGNTGTGSIFAFHATDGRLVWRSQNAPLTHSTPVFATILGVEQVIFAAQDGLLSLNCTNGALLWRAAYPFSFSTSLAASPVVHSNLVFLSANYTMGGFATRITESNGVLAASPAWTNASLKAHWMTPVCHRGHLYGMFGSAYNSPLKCIDMETGTQRWSMSGFGRGGTIVVDNRILVLSEKGDLVLIESNPEAYTEIARLRAFPNYDAYTNKCWNVPAVCDGRIYARSTAEAMCLDVAVPALKMLRPELLPGNRLRLRIGTEAGTTLDQTRVSKIEVRRAGKPDSGATDWIAITNGFSVVNGELVAEIPMEGSAEFYVATERD